MDYTWIAWGITGASLAVAGVLAYRLHKARKSVRRLESLQAVHYELIDEQADHISGLENANYDAQLALSGALALDTPHTDSHADKPESVGEREARKFLKKTAAW